MIIKNNTPIEIYQVKGRAIHVKREDLCVLPPGPPFSKCRGLFAKLSTLKATGTKVIGYVETPISMAGWGVACLAKQLDMKAVIFEPQYAGEHPATFDAHKKMWNQFEPDILPVKAGRTCVNVYICTKVLHAKYGSDAVMLPTGIPFEETVNETAKEWQRTVRRFQPDATVICVGSGTICAGVLKGMTKDNGKLIGIMAYSKNKKKKIKTIWRKAGKYQTGFFAAGIDFVLIDPKWEYTEQCESPCPFPCHSYYDLKAWQWLVENIDSMPNNILFWNIGSEHGLL